MPKKQLSFLLLAALAAGFMGGAASSELSTIGLVFAQKKQKAQKILSAEEFRLVSKTGQTVATLRCPVEGCAALVLSDITKKDHPFCELCPDGIRFLNPEGRSSFSYISECLRLEKGDSAVQISFRDKQKPYVALMEKEKVVWAAPQQ